MKLIEYLASAVIVALSKPCVGPSWNIRKRSEMPVTITEGLAATDKGSFYNQQARFEEYTYGKGLYHKGKHSDSSNFFS